MREAAAAARLQVGGGGSRLGLGRRRGRWTEAPAGLSPSGAASVRGCAEEWREGSCRGAPSERQRCGAPGRPPRPLRRFRCPGVEKAVVRGYLIRKRLQSVRSKYESIVKEIEGDFDWLQWTGHLFPRPAFFSKSSKKSIKQFNREEVKIDKPQKQDAQYFQEASPSKQMCDFEMQFPSRLLPEVTAEPKIGEVGQQALDAHSRNVCSLPGENEEGGEPSNTSSDWSSTVLGMESPRLSQESHFPKAPEIPRGMPDLQNYRRHLAMELLWLQQAIASRKKYLILKRRLGKPA